MKTPSAVLGATAPKVGESVSRKRKDVVMVVKEQTTFRPILEGAGIIAFEVSDDFEPVFSPTPRQRKIIA